MNARSRVLIRLGSPWVIVGLCGLLLAYSPATSFGATAPEGGQASTISGTVLSENGAGLREVVITLEPVSGSRDARQVTQSGETEEAMVINQGGRFVPDLLVISVGTPVTFRSSDGIFHTAEISDAGRLLTHLALPADGRKFEYVFTEPGVIAVKDWMNPRRDIAHIVVSENRYFDISNGQGWFSISGVPAGTYTLRAWHKDLGSRTFTFTVSLTDAKETRVKLVLQEPKLVPMPADPPTRPATGEGG